VSNEFDLGDVFGVCLSKLSLVTPLGNTVEADTGGDDGGQGH